MKKETIDAYVLDTSAWLAFIEDEDGADIVSDLLQKANAGQIIILVSFMTFMEVYYITWQEHDATTAEVRIQLMNSSPVSRVDSTEPLGILSIQGKLSSFGCGRLDCRISQRTECYLGSQRSGI